MIPCPLSRREKNFHIFYYLVAGLSARKQLARYKVKGVHHYLEQRGTAKGSAKRNAIFAERFGQIEKIFCLFGFTNEVCRRGGSGSSNTWTATSNC